MPTKREITEIDRVVDETIHDELAARKLKKALHARYEAEPKKPAPKAQAEDDGDLWDNLPV